MSSLQQWKVIETLANHHLKYETRCSNRNTRTITFQVSPIMPSMIERVLTGPRDKRHHVWWRYLVDGSSRVCRGDDPVNFPSKRCQREIQELRTIDAHRCHSKPSNCKSCQRTCLTAFRTTNLYQQLLNSTKTSFQDSSSIISLRVWIFQKDT